MRPPSRTAPFSRRKLIRGLSCSAALSPFVPLLEAEAAAVSPKRLILFFTPHGTIWDAWKPQGTTSDFTLGPILAPLAPLRKKVSVLSGLRMADVGVGAPHTKGAPLLWTGGKLLEDMTFTRSDGSGGKYFGWNSGASVDQIIADKVGKGTAYRSLEFGVRSGGSHPSSRTIYSAAQSPLPPETDPSAMFKRLFTGKTDQQVGERQSSIDLVKAELLQLRPKASAADAQKLDAHLTSIRAIEQRLATRAMACQGPALMQKIDANAEANMPATLDRQIEILVSAMACDMTRVASLQFTIGDNDNASYTWLGIQEGHHETTHTADNDMVARDKLIKIYTWYADRFAYLLQKLDSIDEGNGTLLDHSIVVWGTELGKGNNHSFDNVPFVVAGGGGGALNMGRFLDYPDGPQHNRLLVSLCQGMGLSEVTSFGNTDNASGPLPNLLG